MVDFSKHLKSRMDTITKGVAPSLVPVAREKKTPKDKPVEVIPDISEIGFSAKGLSLQLTRLGELKKQMKALRAQEKALSEAMKGVMADEVAAPIKMQCNGYVVNYFRMVRETINRKKLIEKGVSPFLIDDCTDETLGWVLKVTEAGTDDDSE